MVGLAVVTLEMAAFSPGLSIRPEEEEERRSPPTSPPLPTGEAGSSEEEEDGSSIIISWRMWRLEGDSKLPPEEEEEEEEEEEALIVERSGENRFSSSSREDNHHHSPGRRLIGVIPTGWLDRYSFFFALIRLSTHSDFLIDIGIPVARPDQLISYCC